MSTLLASLARCNQALLQHKLALLDALVLKHGAERANLLYALPCPLVGHSTLGQHVRHSTDHMERAIACLHEERNQVHYDVRTRGGPDEHNMEVAKQRICQLQETLDFFATSQKHIPLLDHPLNAYFVLEAGSPEVALPSTAARELGFGAHHAIHHLAFVKVIAMQTGGLNEEDLPVDFGKAPSTIQYEQEER